MKNVALLLTFLIFGLVACNNKTKHETADEKKDGPMTHEDSVYEQYLAEQKAYEKYKSVKQDFVFPLPTGGSPELSIGKKAGGLSKQAKEATALYEIYKQELEAAKDDSTTEMGCLMERSTYITSLDRHIMGTYDKYGKLLTLRISDDSDDGEDEEEFVFKEGVLLLYSHKVSETHGTEGKLTQDEFYINNGKVGHAYRDYGTGPVEKGKILNFIDVDRFTLQGDWDAAVADAATRFKQSIALIKNEDFRAAFYYTP
jgi:hypothetical protein